MTEANRKVICTAYSPGAVHDFKLFHKSKTCMHEDITLITDTGYQGINKTHGKSILAKKKSKLHPLSKDDKRNNRKISQRRVVNEHVIRMVKRFKIVADRYRNRRKRFGLRFNLIAGLYNFELE